MCGILGVSQYQQPVDPQRFRAMLATLRSRGPDHAETKIFDQHRAALGHTRLAIIDLSAAGNQPMSNETGRLWITFNGEIYNYVELRTTLIKRGHLFQSQCDTETILHAYEEFGTDCVRHLRGIFAFGIFDLEANTFFLARDHIGVKPLYYQQTDTRFAFASQPRALRDGRGGTTELCPQNLSLFFAYGNIPGEHSIYAGIKKLLPAHWLLYKNQQITLQRYWSARYAPMIKNEPEAEQSLREKITDAVKIQSRSDVPIGTLLSGGIDSAIITALAFSPREKLRTFTIGFNESPSDERPYARLIAETHQTSHHEKVLDYRTACLMLPEIIAACDEPFHLNGLFPFQALAKFVSDHKTKVVLGGDGGDELFAGYLWHEHFAHNYAKISAEAWITKIKNRITNTPFRFIPPAVRYFFRYNGFFTPEAQQRFVGHASENIDFCRAYKILEEYWHPDLPPITAAQLFDLHCFLPDHCLVKVDRCSMAYGVEVRVPLLDTELIELAFSIDSKLVFPGGERKALLKRAMRDCLPSKMDLQRKKGFSSPIQTWLPAGLAPLGQQLLFNGSLCQHGYLRADFIKHRYHQLHPDQQLLLISGELWFRHWIENDTGSITTFAQQAANAPSHVRQY